MEFFYFQDWEDRYLHENYSKYLSPNQPVPEVGAFRFQYPLMMQVVETHLIIFLALRGFNIFAEIKFRAISLRCINIHHVPLQIKYSLATNRSG